MVASHLRNHTFAPVDVTFIGRLDGVVAPGVMDGDVGGCDLGCLGLALVGGRGGGEVRGCDMCAVLEGTTTSKK